MGKWNETSLFSFNYAILASSGQKESDKHFMSVCLRDFSGQNELISTHQLFLGLESTTLIVMDITKPLNHILDKNPKLGHPNTPTAVLHYWLNLLHVKASQKHLQPNVALALTHRDMIQDDNVEMYVETYINDILNTLQGHPYANFVTKDNVFVVDNKSYNETEFENLKKDLFQYLSQERNWGRQMPVRQMKLKANIIEESKTDGRKFLSLASVIDKAKGHGISEKETETFLTTENTLGNFMYFSEPELRENVITDSQWLVDKVTTLFKYH